MSIKKEPSQLFVPAIVVSRFSSMTPSILTGLLLLEIASTFNVEVGIAAQMRTLASTIAMVFAVVMGVLSVKIQAKTLLTIGLGLLIISSAGCMLSTSMNMLMIFYSLIGFATAIITPMCLTLVGENLVLAKRAKAISWIMTGAALAYVIGAPIINTISDYGGWRLSFLGYVAPAALLSLIFVRVSIPISEKKNPKTSVGFFSGFKVIFRNLSAMSCMFGNAMVVASYQAILYFGSSYYRQVFLSSKGFASLLIVGSALSFTLGTQVGGWFVNRYGRKVMSAFPAFIAGIVIIGYMNIPNLYASIVLRFLGSFVVAVSFVGSRSLTLEQEPSFRGTMMSLNSASQSFGNLIGTGVGGFLILRYSYSLVGLVLGFLGLVSSLVYWMLSVDPT